VTDAAAPSPLERFRSLAPPVEQLQGRRAGFVSRGIAFAVDFAIVLVGYPTLLWGWAVLVGLLRFEPPVYPDPPPWLTVVVTVAWTASYFAGGWTLGGRTVGQGVLGLRVVGLRRPTVGLVRSVIRVWVMFATLFVVGPVWLALSRSRLAIHDRVAGTQVVYDRAGRRARVDVALAPAGTARPGRDQAK
jgi:uncharacterized RDD family membrane protein YckC